MDLMDLCGMSIAKVKLNVSFVTHHNHLPTHTLQALSGIVIDQTKPCIAVDALLRVQKHILKKVEIHSNDGNRACMYWERGREGKTKGIAQPVETISHTGLPKAGGHNVTVKWI